MPPKKNGKTLSLKEKIRRGGPHRTVAVWIGVDRGLVDEFETLSAPPEKKQAASLAGSEQSNATDPARDARLAEVRELLSEYEVDFVIRAFGKKRWRALIDEHPPRKDSDGTISKEDRQLGVNMSTFPEALIRAATVSPVLDDGDWQALLGTDDEEGSLTDGQIDDLAATAYALNKTETDVPFWSAASSTSPGTGSE